MTTLTEPLSLVELKKITEQVWSAYLADGVQDGAAVPVEPDRQGVEIIAAISITGAWDGHVVLSYSYAVAGEIAAVLLGLPADEVTEADLSDAAGELANIIGGNVKSLMPQPSALSLPRVIIGSVKGSRWPGTLPLHVVHTTWRDEPVMISVHQVDMS